MPLKGFQWIKIKRIFLKTILNLKINLGNTSLMTSQAFLDSLENSSPPSNLGILLTALWWDAKDNWSKAHDLVDNLGGDDAAWIHAYLHRKEGDQWNANYWYRRAGKSMPNSSLDEEWQSLVDWFLEKG